jgi:phosphohistidine phosphatase
MFVHLLRHAEAEDVSPSGLDADRRLTAAGVKRMKAVAKAIKSLEPGYDLILISPLVRARQTAEPVAEALGYKKALAVTDALKPNADPEAILAELAKRSPKSVLVVGHQPHMGSLFGRLLAGEAGLEVEMKKASLAAFETGSDPSEGPAQLKFYLPPKVLEALG